MGGRVLGCMTRSENGILRDGENMPKVGLTSPLGTYHGWKVGNGRKCDGDITDL